MHSVKIKKLTIYGRATMEGNTRTQIMTANEAAKYLGLHLVTVYRLIKQGKLPCFRVGGQWRFKKDLLDEWIASSTSGKSM